MRYQSTGCDKEDPRLPGIAFQTPSNSPRSTGGSSQFLVSVPILQRAQAA